MRRHFRSKPYTKIFRYLTPIPENIEMHFTNPNQNPPVTSQASSETITHVNPRQSQIFESSPHLMGTQELYTNF